MARERQLIYLIHMNNVLSFADIQTGFMGFFVRNSMLESGCNTTFLRYNAWFKIRQEFLSFVALNLSILNCPPSKSCIQFYSLDCSRSSFILYIQKTNDMTSSTWLKRKYDGIITAPGLCLSPANNEHHGGDYHFSRQSSEKTVLYLDIMYFIINNQ